MNQFSIIQRISKQENLVSSSYRVTHHSVPLQFVDQRCQAATGWFAFSFPHLKQATGHPAFHHCEKKSKSEYKADKKHNYVVFVYSVLSEKLKHCKRIVTDSCFAIYTRELK